jgi:hypothetical protein
MPVALSHSYGQPKGPAELESRIQNFSRAWAALFPTEATTGSKLDDANAKEGLMSPQDTELKI